MIDVEPPGGDSFIQKQIWEVHNDVKSSDEFIVDFNMLKEIQKKSDQK